MSLQSGVGSFVGIPGPVLWYPCRQKLSFNFSFSVMRFSLCAPLKRYFIKYFKDFS